MGLGGNVGVWVRFEIFEMDTRMLHNLLQNLKRIDQLKERKLKFLFSQKLY